MQYQIARLTVSWGNDASNLGITAYETIYGGWLLRVRLMRWWFGLDWHGKYKDASEKAGR